MKVVCVESFWNLDLKENLFIDSRYTLFQMILKFLKIFF